VMSDEVLAPITYRQGKVEAIKRSIGRRPLIVFGDAWTDFEMLTTASLGVLIDRGKADLLRALAATESVIVQPRFPGEVDRKSCVIEKR
jgi:phosphoserine phosphatase